MIRCFLFRCLIILGIFIIFSNFLITKTSYILVTVYEESNYCHALTFKNIIKKLENKDNSNFYLVLKNLDNIELEYLKKDYPNLNLLEDKDKYKLGDFIVINDQDTSKYFIPPNCEERFKPTLIDTVIKGLNYKHRLYKVDEDSKIPIFQLPDFPLESISITDSLLLIMDVRNTIHEINLYSGTIQYQFKLEDTLSDKYLNRNSMNSEYLDIYAQLGQKFKPQNCLYIKNKKYIRYSTLTDVEIKISKKENTLDTAIFPIMLYVLEKLKNDEPSTSKIIEEYPNNSSFFNFFINKTRDTIINVGLLNGIEIYFLDTNYSQLETFVIDTNYKFAEYLTTTKNNDEIILFYKNTLLSFNIKNQKVNKININRSAFKNDYPINILNINNNICFFTSNKNNDYYIFDYKNNYNIAKINDYFDEEIEQIKYLKNEKNSIFFLVKLKKSRWNIFKLEI